MKAPDEQNWYLSTEELLKNAKGFEDLPLEVQESFRTYEREREAKLMEPRPNGGILFPVYTNFPALVGE